MFFKGIKNKFTKAVYNRCVCCAKKIFYLICVTPQLDIFCHNFVKFFGKNYYESLHLMSILVGNDAHPPLYLYMYHMFFSP